MKRCKIAALVSSLALLLVLPLASADQRDDGEKALEKAVAAGDKEHAKEALLEATKPGDVRAAKLLITHALKLRGFGAHQELLDAIKEIKDEAAVKELAQAAVKSSQVDLRYILVEGLGLQGSETAARAVFDALDDKDDSISAVAARATRAIATPEAIERLLKRLEKGEPRAQDAALCRELVGALAAITRQELTFALEWRSWWMSHKDGWKAPAAEEKPADNDSNAFTRMKKNRPEDARTIERLGDDDVIVVKGKSDCISDVLKAIKIKHKEIAPEDLAATKLDPKSVLVLNCNSKLNPYDADQLARIRDFVDKGGYLFTSDWQLEFLLGETFPGSISLDKKIGKDNVKVPILPAASKHPFLRDVFPMNTWDATTFTWLIDSHSELIKIQSPDVVVLVESPELKKQEGGNGAVAVTFRWHNGRVVTGNEGRRQATGGGAGKAREPEGGCVLHVLGHFKHQKDESGGDHFALQQLLLNFFLEKQHAKGVKQ
jgi:hypothetical protein